MYFLNNYTKISAKVRIFLQSHPIYEEKQYRKMRNNKNKVRLTESQLNRIIKESVRKILRESFDNLRIQWKYDGTEVYVNGLYAGYIDSIGERGGWYGRCCTLDNEIPSMESFGVFYNKDELRDVIESYIQQNSEIVLKACEMWES